jgi:hypothetical protein
MALAYASILRQLVVRIYSGISNHPFQIVFVEPFEHLRQSLLPLEQFPIVRIGLKL